MDKSTIRKFRDGSEEAFNLIYKKYYKLIKQICYSYVFNSDTAEDLSIESFVRLWNNKSNIIIGKNLKYYIITIARNVSIDYIRLKERENTILMDVPDLEYINTKLNPDDSSTDTSNELLTKIKDIVDAESYEILVLHYYHKLKYREIAKIKDVTTSVITNKASRAIRLLKEKLKNEN